MNQEEKSILFLALRALAVILLVLLALWGLDRLGVTAIGQDLPQSAVAQCMSET